MPRPQNITYHGENRPALQGVYKKHPKSKNPTKPETTSGRGVKGRPNLQRRLGPPQSTARNIKADFYKDL